MFQPSSLFSRSAAVDAALLYGVMQATSRSPQCVPGYEGLSCGFNRQTLGFNCDEVYPNIFVGDA